MKKLRDIYVILILIVMLGYIVPAKSIRIALILISIMISGRFFLKSRVEKKKELYPTLYFLIWGVACICLIYIRKIFYFMIVLFGIIIIWECHSQNEDSFTNKNRFLSIYSWLLCLVGAVYSYSDFKFGVVIIGFIIICILSNWNQTKDVQLFLRGLISLFFIAIIGIVLSIVIIKYKPSILLRNLSYASKKPSKIVNASKIPSPTEKILFEVNMSYGKCMVGKPDNSLYLKTAIYEKYNNGNWMDISQVVDNDKEEKILEQLYFQYEVLLEALAHAKLSDELSYIISKPSNKNHQIIATYIENEYIYSPVNPKYIDVFGGNKEFFKEDGIINCEGTDGNIHFDSLDFNTDSREVSFIKYLNKERYNQILKIIKKSDNQLYENIIGQLNDNILMSYEEIYETYIQLPSNIDERILKLGKQLIDGKISDYDKAKSIEDFLKNGEYIYDMKVKEAPWYEDPVSYFLFKEKKGVCNQYASSMVLLVRAAGLPARYVIGYLTSEYNEEFNRYTVRESNCHAYVEVYIPGAGWVMFDPTPSGEIIPRKETNIKYTSVVILSSLIIGISMIFILIKRKLWWKCRVLYGNDKEAIQLLLKQYEKILAHNYGYIQKGETLTMYQIKVYQASLEAINLENIVKQYHNIMYGSKKFDLNIRKELIDDYYAITKQVRKQKHNQVYKYKKF